MILPDLSYRMRKSTLQTRPPSPDPSVYPYSRNGGGWRKMFHEESPLSYCRSTPPTGVRISRNAFFYISLRDPYMCTRRVKTLNRLRIVERKREREGERKEANTWAAQQTQRQNFFTKAGKIFPPPLLFYAKRDASLVGKHACRFFFRPSANNNDAIPNFS